MRSEQETNTINRTLRARGLPTLDQPGVAEAFARVVDDHEDFMKFLRKCEPEEQRNMYEAMRPHLRFKPKPLEDYQIAAKQYAEAAELPVTDEYGMLHPYRIGVVEVAEVQLWAQCAKCGKEGIFMGSTTPDAIFTMRSSGWAYDESSQQKHLCPECLEGGPEN